MRTLNDLEQREEQFPPPGQYTCRCIGVEKWVSPKKGTPAIRLEWRTQDGESEFSDLVFLTPRAIGRLAIAARGVCDVGNIELPDDDDEAIAILEKCLLSATGRGALVTVEEEEYEDIHQSGPRMGEKYTRRTRRVGFRGYAPAPASASVDALASAPAEDDDNLPF